MNQMKMYIDTIFAKYEKTAETEDFHDEIIANSETRYQEYLKEGLSPEQAEEKVIQHLGDIDSVLREMTFTKKQPHDEWKNQLKDWLDHFSAEMEDFGKNIGQYYNQKYSNQEMVKHGYPSYAQVGIQCESADITVYENDTDTLQMTFEDEVFDVIRTEDSILLKEKTGMTAQEVILSVPTGTKRLKIMTKNGDVETIHPTLEELEIETLSGDLDLNLDNIHELRCQTTSGDIECQLQGQSGSVILKSTSGDIEIEQQGILQTKISTTSGDVHLVTEDESYDAVQISTVSGDVEFEAGQAASLNLNIKTISGDVEYGSYRHGEENPTTIATVSGDIECN